MRKFRRNILLSIAFIFPALLCAQTPDHGLHPKFCIDGNFFAGSLSQKLQGTDFTAGYINPLNVKTGTTKISKPGFTGFNLQGGVFFGIKQHFGLGTGLMLLSQKYTLKNDGVYLEYEATDVNGNVYRKILTSKSVISESHTAGNYSVPLVLKYKTSIKGKWGFTLDAGINYSFSVKDEFTVNSVFDHEAIYLFDKDNPGKTIYDISPEPNQLSWLITRDAYLKKHPDGDVNAYFSELHAQGYDVGLARETNQSGKVSAAKGTIGFLIQPSVSYALNKNLALHLGGFFSTQKLKNSGYGKYNVFDDQGNYYSLVGASKTAVISNYGLQIGFRYFFPETKDRDGDHVSDRKDKCPDIFGLAQFDGCPDKDGDGVPDKDDVCPEITGLIYLHGCSDTDGDSIPDQRDECPTIKGIAAFKGCPDTDGDGIPDSEDACPDVTGLKENRGCPAEKKEVVTEPVTKEVEKTPVVQTPATEPAVKTTTKETISGDVIYIKFAEGSARFINYNNAILDALANELKVNSELMLSINGHTDNIGGDEYNMGLSDRRVQSVKNYLVNKGVPESKLKQNHFGLTQPKMDNRTKEGKAANRRVELIKFTGK